MPQLGRFSPGTLHQPLCSRPSRASWSSASTHPPPFRGRRTRVAEERPRAEGFAAWGHAGASPLLLSAAGLSAVAVPTALYALGFTKAGITVGSVAARMMSLAAKANGGGVAAESLVAIAQSLGECSQWGARGVTTVDPVFWPPRALQAAWREPGVVVGLGTPPIPGDPTCSGVPGVAPLVVLAWQQGK